MYCYNCGKELTEEGQFCKYCGAKKEMVVSDSGATGRRYDNKKNILFIIGVLCIMIGIVCFLFYITWPAGRSECAPFAYSFGTIGAILMVVSKFVKKSA